MRYSHSDQVVGTCQFELNGRDSPVVVMALPVWLSAAFAMEMPASKASATFVNDADVLTVLTDEVATPAADASTMAPLNISNSTGFLFCYIIR